MPITFSCPCGKTLRVPDEHAGRRARCPTCAALVDIPGPEPELEVVEGIPEPKVSASLRARPVATPVASKSLPGRRSEERHIREDDEDDRSYELAQPDRTEEDRPRPVRKKWKRRRSSSRNDTSGPSFERGIINSGVAGGLLAMVIAAVWFVVGLMNDWLYFYPPVLFIIGMVAFLKGLAGEE